MSALRRLLRDPWTWLGLGLAVVYLRGLFLDVMDVDASQYASISMEMLQDGHWLEVQHRHADYLDKPPLLFWSSAFSFLLFGLHNWAYKLPSFLASLAGIYATYRFCRLYYTRDTARHAAFILAACVGVLLLCNDVRTDTLLMAMTACAVWQLAAFVQAPAGSAKQWRYLIGAGAFVGLAMLAKGPIGLVMPAFAAGTHLLWQRNWRQLFQWKWLLVPVVAGVVLAPMCWGLYRQYDLHPEKIINARQGVSGLYFFFWEQSFGRITGENVWKNDTSPFFFLHVYLWAFLPWPLLLAAGLWDRFRDLFRQKFRPVSGDEAFSLGGFVLTFAALSMSHYKLPHYIFITLPCAAVLTARWLSQAPAIPAAWRYAQHGVYVILATAAVLLLGFVFPTGNLLLWAIPLALFGWVARRILFPSGPSDAAEWVQRGVLTFSATAFVLNFHFYPQLLPYQSTAAVPRYALQHGIPADKLAFFNRHGHALDFYADRILSKMDTPAQLRDTAVTIGPLWLYTNTRGLEKLDSAGLQYTETARFDHFQVALLKPAFLNPALRPQTLDTVYLLKILREQER